MSDGGPPFRFASARLPLFVSGGMRLVASTAAALVTIVAWLSLAGAAWPFAPAALIMGLLGGGVTFFAATGLYLGLGERRIASLRADADGLELLTLGANVHLIAWSTLRAVEFRRLRLGFKVARRGAAVRRYVFTVDWRDAEDFLRLKNYFVERMEAARASEPKSAGSQ